ncbi:unnamed protein product [Didymodactylos carnosus]|uniref:Leucine-rich repeat-containing protein 51 n=1 Tax=Didymodactylos carnosus TaxID=1234261 RepID=A0A814Y8S4_9BILA|nr:unnamed protein product [Didymodactylos carnosus]CAF3989397.1 unnamed protein product [Didymodactylos carnosus]
MTDEKPPEQFIQKRIDNSTESYPPLDFSFHNAQRVEDAISAEPRVAANSPGLRLSDVVTSLLVDPNMLYSLDLSFNIFTEIPVVVTQFKSLKYLYLHKNLINDIAETKKLVQLKDLKYLTLHENPIEASVPYLRSYILYILPFLKSLNFTPVTKADLKTSETWGKMNKVMFKTIKKPSNK